MNCRCYVKITFTWYQQNPSDDYNPNRHALWRHPEADSWVGLCYIRYIPIIMQAVCALPCFQYTIVESAASGSHPTDSEFHVEWLSGIFVKSVDCLQSFTIQHHDASAFNINHWHYMYKYYIYIYIYIYDSPGSWYSRKCTRKMSSAKWRPYCLDLSV